MYPVLFAGHCLLSVFVVAILGFVGVQDDDLIVLVVFGVNAIQLLIEAMTLKKEIE